MFNDIEHKKRALMIRDWGRIGDNSEYIDDRFNYEIDNIPYDYKFLYCALGYNMKCCEMCAAFGLVQLKKFEIFASPLTFVFFFGYQKRNRILCSTYGTSCKTWGFISSSPINPFSSLSISRF